MCAMCSSAATPPRSCWTGQLTEQVLTARSCTCTAQQATSCGAAQMGSGGTLSTIIKARRCDIPPETTRSEILDLCARILGETMEKRDTDVPGSLRHCHSWCGRGRLRRCKLS